MPQKKDYYVQLQITKLKTVRAKKSGYIPSLSINHRKPIGEALLLPRETNVCTIAKLTILHCANLAMSN